MGQGKFYADRKTGTFNYANSNPFSGLAIGEEQASDVVARCVNEIIPLVPGITDVIGKELELDVDSYAVHVTGTPVITSRVGGSVVGYSIHVSIYARPDVERREGDSVLAG